jgi:hypothetical protein
MRITIVVYFLPDAGNHASSAVSTKWVLQELQLPELCQSLLDDRGLQKCYAKSYVLLQNYHMHSIHM